MVIALAGRRVDAPKTAQLRFPTAQTVPVKQRIREFLQTHQASALVCAAACGTDILALEAAGELGRRRRVILPFDKAAFRSTSVVDRGGDWGARYDAILTELEAQCDVIEAAHDKDDPQTWFNGNLDILDEAQRLARELETDVAALIVWDGQARGADDATAHFQKEALRRGLSVSVITTL
jgi:hypothetical protein